MPKVQAVKTVDNFELSASLYASREQTDKVVILASALGVKQKYYEKFAKYLAHRGFATYTFDYRGMGMSRPQNQSLRGFQANFTDWAKKDIEGVISHARAQWPGAKLYYVGHSLGGQLFGFVPSSRLVEKALFVVAQSGYWKNWSGPMRAAMWTSWHLLLPTITNVVGYLPTKELRLFESVPKAASLQWARWGRHKDYLFSEATQENSHYHQLETPILAYSFSDDLYTPIESVRAYLKQLKRAAVTHRHINPKVIGEGAIGHFGFFREKYEDLLWNPAVEWLAEH